MTTIPEKNTLDDLESRIGYQFTDRELLTEAITHPSRAGETNARSNQRLEFLGDAVLDLLLAQELLLQHPSWATGSGSGAANVRPMKVSLRAYSPTPTKP